MLHENGYHYIVDDRTGKVLCWRQDIFVGRVVNSITGQCLNPEVDEAKNRAGHRRRREGFRMDPPGSIRCGADLYRKLGFAGPVTRGFDIGPVRKASD